MNEKINEVENKVKSKKFRLNAKKAFLTYSQVPLEATKEELLLTLQNKVSFAHYVVGRELHQDGGAHFHAVLISNKKFDIRNANMLDVELSGTKFHGNYTAIRHLNASIEYACKHGDYITNLDSIKDGKVTSIELLLAEKFSKQGRYSTLQEYFSDKTKQAFGKTDLVSVDKLFNLLQQIESNKLKPIKSNYKIEDFKVNDRLATWIKSKEKPTLLLVGPSGAGKTQFILSLAEKLNWQMLVINHLEGLKQLASEHDAIFFDDFTFSKIEEEQLLALIDTEYQKDIRILYKSIRKDPGLAQVFAINPTALSRIKHLISQEQFSRRIDLIEIPRDFIQNVQINININNVENVYLNSNETTTATESEAPSVALTRAAVERARIKANNEVLNTYALHRPGGTDLDLVDGKGTLPDLTSDNELHSLSD